LLSLETNHSDYHLAQYVLSKSNCVTLNELESYSFLQQTISPHVDGLTCFDAIDKNHDISDDDKVDHVARSLHYEILDNSFDTTFSTPAKGEHNNMSRLHQKSHLRISPSTKSLHGTIAENSQSKILMHSEESIQVTRANILKNLDWIISYGDIFNNQNTLHAINEIEKLVQEKKIAVMKDVVNSSTDLPEGSVDWAGICTRKRKPSERLKGDAR
jgi:hypothetical protein